MPCPCDRLAPVGATAADVCLGGLWLFASLSEDEMQALSWRPPSVACCPPAATCSCRASRHGSLFVIKAGRIKLTKTDAEGNEILVDIRKAGDFIGETFLSEDADYPLTAECVAESLLCGITRERFERLVREKPNIGLQIMRTMSERIDWLTSRVGDLASTHLEERLYAVLSTVAREHGTRTEAGLVIEFPLTHEELSFLVGAHRVSVTKALKARQHACVRVGRHLSAPTAHLAWISGGMVFTSAPCAARSWCPRAGSNSRHQV